MKKQQKWINYGVFISQLIFTNLVAFVFLYNQNYWNMELIAFGYILLALSFLILIIPWRKIK